MTHTASIRERYNETELAEFKMLIQQKLTKSKEEYFFYKNQLTDLSANGDTKIRSLDDGSGVSENEYIASAAARLQKHIQHLENALLRVDNKVYGICRATGKLIPKERLLAVPHATLSIEAKMNNLG
jgi:DnaK suppressor protein